MTSKLLTLAVLGMAAVAVSAHGESLTLAGSLSPAAGSSFDLVVQLTDAFDTHPGDGIAAFGFDVVIGDLSLISYTGETIGGDFDDVSGVFGPSPQVAGFVTAGFLEEGDFTEPLTLATLHFQSLGPGTTTVGISTDLTDPNQGLLYLLAGADAMNVTANVTTSGAAAPEPGGVYLGGLGGLALGLVVLLRTKAARSVETPGQALRLP